VAVEALLRVTQKKEGKEKKRIFFLFSSSFLCLFRLAGPTKFYK